MIRALSIETSSRNSSVALSEDGAIVAEGGFTHGLQHAAKLLPMIDDLTRRRGWKPDKIDHIYLSIGPGSFTGLRIAVTLAKTLALATSARIVAVPSVRVLLENVSRDAREVIIVLDAKRGQIFTARFYRASSDELWTECEAAHLDTLSEMLQRAGRPVELIGEGISYHRDSIPTEPGIVVTTESHWQPRAAAVDALGRIMATAGDFTADQSLTPLYIRRPEAEEKRLIAAGLI